MRAGWLGIVLAVAMAFGCGRVIEEDGAGGAAPDQDGGGGTTGAAGGGGSAGNTGGTGGGTGSSGDMSGTGGAGGTSGASGSGVIDGGSGTGGTGGSGGYGGTGGSGGVGSKITPSLEGVPFKEVQVHMGNEVKTVQVEGLPTSTLLDQTVVLVATLIEASGFEVDLAGITIDFEGSDGYRPTQQGMCTKNLPTAGTNASECGINLETSELLWDESLEVEKCAAVKLVAHIYLEPAE
jgi:hypothetical protein